MQALIKDKDDISAAFQHVEAKFSDAEMEREQIKLLLQQEKEQNQTQAGSIQDLQEKLSTALKESEGLRESMKKQDQTHTSAKNSADEKISQLEEQCSKLKISGEEQTRRIEDLKQLETSLRGQLRDVEENSKASAS